jgi:hypothetical protein
MKDIQVFTPQYAIELIDRELGKRATTYSKTIARRRKAFHKEGVDFGLPTIDVMAYADGMEHADTVVFGEQINALTNARKMVMEMNVLKWEMEARAAALAELKRELKMRQKCYPRFIYLKRITPEVAKRELADWETLVEYFTETFISKN